MSLVRGEVHRAEIDLEQVLTNPRFILDQKTLIQERLGVLKNQTLRISTELETDPVKAEEAAFGLPLDKMIVLYTARGTVMQPTLSVSAHQLMGALAGWEGNSWAEKLQAASKDISRRAEAADLIGATDISYAFRCALAAGRAYSRPFNTYRPDIDPTKDQEWDSALLVARIPVAGINPLYYLYKDPYPAIVELQGYCPERLAFIKGEFDNLRVGRRFEERLMVDLRLDLRARGFSLEQAACLSFGLQADMRDPFLFVHKVEEDCTARQPLKIGSFVSLVPRFDWS